MELKEFDEKFRELYTNMVEIAYEYVNRNKEEVDDIYIYGSMEAGDFYYKSFYKINGHVVKMHYINTVSKMQYDISRDRMIALMRLGVECLEATEKLFKEDNREVPTVMKINYSPKTGKFDNDISYQLHYSNVEGKTVAQAYDEWFVEMGGKLD